MEVGERKNPITIYENWITHDIMIIGYTYNELKNYGKKGLKMYEKVVEAIPTFGEAYYKLALVQKDLGNDELSMINMKKAADLRDPEALKFLEQTAQ